MSEPAADDPLAELRERLREAEESARRLADELPGGDGTSSSNGRTAQDAQALAALLHTLRGLVPPELQDQLRDLIRQVLTLVRALIDRSLASLEPGEPAAPEIHDIEVGE
jgi:predicted phage gp36 major capsid-like protein